MTTYPGASHVPTRTTAVFDAQAYLAWEAEQSTKHEYHDGEVFAMAGASDAHVTVAGNVYMALRNHLRGSPCSVFISAMKLRVEEDNAFFTPMSSSPAPTATVGRATARVPPCW